MSRIQCLLFDNDGTLVDSEWLCNRAIAILFRPLGVRLDTAYLVKHYRGGELAKIFANLAETHHVTLSDDFIERYRAVVAELFKRKLNPISGIPEALEQLPQAKAVVSNGPLTKIQQALDLCGLSQYFNKNLFSAYDIGFFKPDPAIYLCSAQKMGFAPSQCAVIEDSMAGIEAGVKAGMHVFFYNPHQEHCPFEQVYQFENAAQLPSLIAKIR
ncbi:HAD-IA family hydrolase [Flavobacterium sp. W21_SRS_FM6]|uniref:HAD-IA family hydrolase n=1 Tax=Flavobacterium sp. W21_SRS_FM6 TaxID=3240268 RepID=UPI003F9237E5